jgi:3-hydroxyisobutyrate dehydrogenase-like beta-hydroxyacid dehydrogenase
MGAPIARNLIGAGHALTVYNRTRSRAFKLLKDNRLLLEAAEERAVPMPLASLVRDRFMAAMATGLSESDWAAIARVSYRNAGLNKEGDE